LGIVAEAGVSIFGLIFALPFGALPFEALALPFETFPFNFAPKFLSEFWLPLESLPSLTFVVFLKIKMLIFYFYFYRNFT
jgi:hypothetical protein